MRILPLTVAAAAFALFLTAAAQADTVQESFSLTGPTLGLNQTDPAVGYVNQFNTSLGTLTGVTITYGLQVEASNTLHNEGSSVTGVSLVLAGSLTVEIPVGTVISPVYNLAHTSDSSFDLSNGQSVTVNTHYEWNGISPVSYSSNLSAFEGSGQWAYSISGVMTSATASPSDNDVHVENSEITSYLNTGQVTYTYTPTPAPEPEAYALIGLGLAAMMIFRKRRRSRH